ncbi:ankyrin repeat domain-containing protein [Planomonospora sp. ID91781]|uniref:ankyrin repeat domain-containing protein n=1 Tax=Planomonospora sp. ID91781 TaxID=2738135 RepID=UPI0018C39302|nr:ankyrin repeat domain-containing protein [Planomonospora sp. ID91781]MBG0819306.1 ankyrin repeat domain-containing protein [Planomonospora sp. ID91781]
MAATDDVRWWGVNDWTDLDLVRAELAAGADPNYGAFIFEKPLHAAADRGSPEVVAELARLVDDVDAEREGRTALWMAVFEGRADNARALVSAGADPWRPMMAGWSPGRLSLVGPAPDLFSPSPEAGLSAAEAAAVAEAERLIPALGDFYYDGLGLACVAELSAAEATARLEAVPADGVDIDELYEDSWNKPDAELIVGVTDVPGGCVIIQPWGYTPSTRGLLECVSPGTVCYSMYANPKGGSSGDIARDGTVITAWEPYSAYTVPVDAPAEEILAAYLYSNHPVAFCCAGAGLHLNDAGPIIGSDRWLKLPERDWWT